MMRFWREPLSSWPNTAWATRWTRRTTMGPLADRHALKTLAEQVEQAVARARVLLGGGPVSESLANFFPADFAG